MDTTELDGKKYKVNVIMGGELILTPIKDVPKLEPGQVWQDNIHHWVYIVGEDLHGVALDDGAITKSALMTEGCTYLGMAQDVISINK
jgi:hypothetical protein